MLKKIDFFHSLIFFNFCIFLSSINFIHDQNYLLVCLFLIMSIGISHGSLDNIKGKKLLKIFKVKGIEKFYLTRIYGNYNCDTKLDIKNIETKMTLYKKIKNDDTCHFEIWKK